MERLDLVHLGWLAAASGFAGGLTGVLAGLFGVGGGTVIVPVLYQVFALYGVGDEIRMQLCVGTSLAIIIPTSISSFHEHYRRGTVDIQVLRAWIAPIAAGVAAGIFVAAFARPFVFKIVFVVVCLFLAVRLLAGKDNWKLGGNLPGSQLMASYGVVIGVLASIMGHRRRAAREYRAQSLWAAYSQRGIDGVGSWAYRLGARRARLRDCRLGPNISAARVTGLCLLCRVCVADASEPADGSVWSRVSSPPGETSPRIRACELPDLCQRRFRFHIAVEFLRGSTGRVRIGTSLPVAIGHQTASTPRNETHASPRFSAPARTSLLRAKNSLHIPCWAQK